VRQISTNRLCNFGVAAERPEKLVAYLGLNPGQRESGRRDLRHLLVQGAHAVLRAGRAIPLSQWGWKLFVRKGNRNVAMAAGTRKLAVQVWHLLWGNPPGALETNKSLNLKLNKLSVTLGKSLRKALQLPHGNKDCVLHFHQMILSSKNPETA
jgi:transposase